MTNTSVFAAELRSVEKTFTDGVATQVLFDINLAVAAGEFVALLGASGSGKTTLLNLMGLLDTPTAGEVWLGGKNVGQLSDRERALFRRDYLGFIFQFHHLLPEFTALENALMPCRLQGGDSESRRQPRLIELLSLVGLKDRLHFRPGKLSGGQQQRVAIVRALANDPVLVLADEPTGNLDSKSGREVFNLMRTLNLETHKAFVMVTHDEALAREADRVIHIRDGRIAV